MGTIQGQRTPTITDGSCHNHESFGEFEYFTTAADWLFYVIINDMQQEQNAWSFVFLKARKKGDLWNFLLQSSLCGLAKPWL